MLYLRCINRSLDLTLTMVIFRTINKNNETFQNKTEKLQYRASLAISGVIQRTLKEKNYDELGLHSLTNGNGSVNLFYLIKWLTIALYLFIFGFLF